MRGWTTEEQRIRSMQTDPRDHDGLIYDAALAARNDLEVEIACSEMCDRFMDAGDIDAVCAPDDEAAPLVETVECSCGHTIPRSQVMNASLGSSCPDCYDRLSA